MKLKYNLLGYGFTVNVENKKDGIELSDLKSKEGRYYDRHSAKDIVNLILFAVTENDKDNIKKQILDDIKEIEEALLEAKMKLKMCQRKKVYFKKQ